MESYLEQALSLVKAQASVRPMSEDDMCNMITSLVAKLQKIASCECADVDAPEAAPSMDPKKSIKEKSITCLECGKVFKVITKKHLVLHGLDAAAYREKWGLKKGTPLTCKELQKARRAKMKDMKLWEKRAMARAMKGGDGEL